MGFVLQERWIEKELSRVAATRREVATYAALPKRWDPRNAAALLMAAIIHVLLACAMISHLRIPDFVKTHKPASRSSLAFFDLNRLVDAQAAPPQLATVPESAPSHALPPESTKTFPSEWQSVPIRVAHTTAVHAALPSTGSPAASAAASQYDPYAGAAPDRPAEADSMAIGHSRPMFSMAMIARTIDMSDPRMRIFIQTFMSHHPSIHGMAVVRIEIGVEGKVRRVLSIAGTVTSQDQQTLRSELQGAVLAPPDTPSASIRIAGPMILGS